MDKRTMRSKRALGVGAVFASLLVIGSTFSTAPPAVADPIGSEECFPAVLMLRGSGEEKTDRANSLGYALYPSGTTSTMAQIHTNGCEG